MTIYLDVIWLLNFGIDAFLILLTSMVLKRSISKKRVIAGGLVGSSIVILMFTPIAAIALHPISKIIISMCIVLASFGYKRFRTFIQTLLMFYFVTFIIGGGMVALHFFFKSDSELMNGVLATKASGFGDAISWSVVIIGFPVLWFFSKTRIEDVEVRKVHYDQLVKVEIVIDETTLQLTGLIDSGNQLYDPITKTPVMILDCVKLADQLPQEILNKTKSIEHLTVIEEDQAHPWERRLRVIPYRVVGKENQLLIALKPDVVKVYDGYQTINLSKVLVGMNHTSLSSDGEYDCILHPKMMLHQRIETA